MSRQSIHIDYLLPFGVEDVWRAWTKPALMMQWFGSDPDGTVVKAEADPRPGGHFQVTFRNADQTEFTCSGSYKKVEPPRLLTFTWTWANEPGEVSHVSVRLTAAPGGNTAMSFTHADLWMQSAHDYHAGWTRTFGKLERALRA